MVVPRTVSVKMKVIFSFSLFLLCFSGKDVVATDSNKSKEEVIEATAKSMRGKLLSRDDEEYEKVRSTLLWNPDPTIVNDPAYIAVCEGAVDVSNAILFAKELGLEVSVRGGGHSVRGLSTNKDGLVIDLRNMNSVRVNETGKFAWAEGGCKLRDVHMETFPRGLAATTGTVSCTGIGGLTTTGGFNFLGRMYGYAVDNVMAVEMVTANGEFVTANKDENPDLFWAVRGGGGSFGVVTAFQLELHPFPREIYAGMWLVAEDQCMDLIAKQGEWYNNAPPEAAAIVVVFSPEGTDTMCGIIALHGGEDPEEGKKVLSPLREIPIAVDMMDVVAPEVFTSSQDAGFCLGPAHYWATVPFKKNILYSDKGKEMIKKLSATRPASGVIAIEPWYGVDAAGSKMTKRGKREAATAFNARKNEFTMMLIGMFDPSDMSQRSAIINWVQESRKVAMEVSGATTTEYSNYSSENTGNTSKEYKRLQKLKDKWDPENIFSNTQLGIVPTKKIAVEL